MSEARVPRGHYVAPLRACAAAAARHILSNAKCNVAYDNAMMYARALTTPRTLYYKLPYLTVRCALLL